MFRVSNPRLLSTIQYLVECRCCGNQLRLKAHFVGLISMITGLFLLTQSFFNLTFYKTEIASENRRILYGVFFFVAGCTCFKIAAPILRAIERSRPIRFHSIIFPAIPPYANTFDHHDVEWYC